MIVGAFVIVGEFVIVRRICEGNRCDDWRFCDGNRVLIVGSL